MSNATDELILEGIIVTVDSSGQPNIAPMGPSVTRDLSRLVLRPFQSSQTYQNVKSTGAAVFHITDDVLLLAHAAIGSMPGASLMSIGDFPCPRLSDTCRWLALRVATLDDSSQRTQIGCDIVQVGEVRPFFGFNRAKHAVLEAAILATRIGILPDVEIQEQLQRLSAPVQKTAGSQERAAFTLLQDYIHSRLQSSADF
jgi:hypothetical protein